MATRVVNLRCGFDNGDIEIPNRGRTWAERGDNIIWHIMPHSGIQSIVDIKPKSISDDIFVPGDPAWDGRHWTGDIKSDVPIGSEFHYFIFWKNMNGDRRTCDPIISIRPSTGGIPVASLLLATAAIASLALFLYLRRRRAKQRASEDLQHR